MYNYAIRSADNSIERDFSQRACDLIKEGYVKVNGRMIDKPAFQVEEQDATEIEEAENDFASRAGGKLFHALEEFKVDLHDKVVLDVGASTGGFTDVCLNKGAERSMPSMSAAIS